MISVSLLFFFFLVFACSRRIICISLQRIIIGIYRHSTTACRIAVKTQEIQMGIEERYKTNKKILHGNLVTMRQYKEEKCVTIQIPPFFRYRQEKIKHENATTL